MRDGTRTRRLATAGGIVVLLAAGVAVLLIWRTAGGAPAEAGKRSSAVATATVSKTDLSTSLMASGRLGYGEPRLIKVASEGRVTWLPTAGTLVSRGQPLLRIDDQPVVLMYGTTPLFRPVGTRGQVGRDVKVVTDNLGALGYTIGRQPKIGSLVQQPALDAAPDPGRAPAPSAAPKGPQTAGAGGKAAPAQAPASAPPLKVHSGDAVVTPSVISAIKRWQDKAGLPQTGIIGPGNVVVQPQQLRVATVQAALGDAASANLLSAGATAKVVTAQMSRDESASVKPGNKVNLTLPASTTAKGTVSDVTVVPAEPNSNQEDKAVVSVTVDDAAAIKSLETASVQVEFTGEVRRGVLAVPVGALLALSEGGYALQIPGGRLIAVKTGLFAKGLVEVTGAGVTDGMKVVTAS